MKSDYRKSATSASESRKIRKPLMEKKRRARINDSLETLKQILLDSKTTLKESSGKKNGHRTAKLEKADILEMTVRYLQHLKSKINNNNNYDEPQVRAKKEIEIRPADSSCDKYGMALVPARLQNGAIAFVLPANSVTDQTYKKALQNDLHEGQSVWRPW